MSKTITEKIKEMLSPEDLLKFESVISSMIKDGVAKKLKEITALQEDEMKKKYDALAEKYISKELGTLVEEEKAKLVSTYDKKLSNLEEKIVAKERKKGFEFSRVDRFRYRTRYFTDSGIIGSKAFVADHYQRFRHLFYSKHEKKPKPIKGLDGMYSLKRLSELI